MPTTTLPADDRPYALLVGDGDALTAVDRNALRELLMGHGAIMLRGFASNLDAFGALARSLCPVAVLNESGKRLVLDSGQAIQSVNLGNREFPLHPEISREPWKPDCCFFYCVKPPANDGQTTMCDGIAIVDDLPEELVQQMSERRLLYRAPASPSVLNFWLGTSTPNDALLNDPPATCPYQFRRIDGMLVREFTRPLLHRTRFQGKLSFGNFLLFARYLRGVTNYPLLDDGTPVPTDWVEAVKEASDRRTVPAGWQAGDLLILDNSRFMHGRTAVGRDNDRMIATYFGYLADVEPDPEEPVDPIWRRADFSPPVASEAV